MCVDGNGQEGEPCVATSHCRNTEKKGRPDVRDPRVLSVDSTNGSLGLCACSFVLIESGTGDPVHPTVVLTRPSLGPGTFPGKTTPGKSTRRASGGSFSYTLGDLVGPPRGTGVSIR